MNSRVKHICWTLNNPSPSDVEEVKTILEAKADYAVFGVEMGAAGNRHLQGYVELNGKTRLSTFANWFPKRPHVEKRKGGRTIAMDYCKKGTQSHASWELDGRDGAHFGVGAEIWETGEPPVEDKCGEQGKRTDIEKVRDLCLSGDIVTEWQLLNSVTSWPAVRFGTVFLNNMPQPPMRSPPTVYWIHGGTGSGKSFATAGLIKKLARNRGWSYWRNNLNLKWFDGYHRQEIVWIDDYRWSGKECDFVQLLGLLDVYPVRVPIKGGFVQWKPRMVIFTSPRNFNESFDGLREDIAQLDRRITDSFAFGTVASPGPGHQRWTEKIDGYLASGVSQRLPRDFKPEVVDSDDEESKIAIDRESKDDEDDGYCTEPYECPEWAIMPPVPRLSRSVACNHRDREVVDLTMTDSEDESDAIYYADLTDSDIEIDM